MQFSTNRTLPPESRSQPGARVSPGQAEVLAVDDEPMILGLIQGCLQNEGFKVWTAHGGRAAMRLLREHTSISVIILDWKLGRLDGTLLLDCFQVIRPGLPVIVTSGSYAEDVVQAFGGRDMVRFLRKPFAISDLISSVAGLAQCSPPCWSGCPLC